MNPGRTEIEGVWWRADRTERQVPGRLVASNDDVKLSLIGSTFHDEPANPFGVGEFPLVYGVGGGRFVTLQGCIDSEVNLTVPGTVMESMVAEAAYIGAHLQRFEATRARVSFTHLPEWAEPPAATRERIEGVPPGGVRLEYRPPPDLKASLSDAALELVLDWSAALTRYDDITLQRPVFFALAFPQALALPELHRRYLVPLENLLTLATGAANAIVSLDIWPPTEAGAIPRDPRPVRVVYPQIAKLPEPTVRLAPDRLLFRARDIETDFTGFIGRWLQLSEELDSVCSLLFSHVRAPAPYSETNFLIVSQAAEVLHRRRFVGSALDEEAHRRRIEEVVAAAPAGHRHWLVRALRYSNEKNLEQRIQELIAHVGDIVGIALSAPEFSRRVADTRNYFTHWTPERKATAASGEELVDLTERLELLVRVALLLELGFDRATCRSLVSANREAQHFKSL